MLFSEMLALAKKELVRIRPEHDFRVGKLSADSRNIEPGDIFFAIKGYSDDGNKYIDEVLSKGASAVFTEVPGREEHNVYLVRDCRKMMAELSNVYYHFPSHQMNMIGITGTNGKTTTASIINYSLAYAGKDTGLIGTNGNYIKDEFIPSSHTTPDSIELNRLLYEMNHRDVKYVSMEVSSHSLSLKRVYGIDFDVVVFTNLTPEHLDFHTDMDSYFEAKKILFDSVPDVNKKGNRVYAIYNNDDLFGKRITADSKAQSYSYGFKDADITVSSLKMDFTSMSFKLHDGKESIDIKSKLTGKFNVYNLLASYAVLKSLGVSTDVIVKAFENFTRVDGRFNVYKLKNGSFAVIDYSHTPDSLLQAISSIKEIINSGNMNSQIITVFGCGGNRDKTKRPIMGKYASENSDIVILTSDNPRYEEPMQIIKDIEKGIQSTNYYKESDRKKAVDMAVGMSKENDIILIAGKGHEDYQEIKGEKFHLSDKELISSYL